MVTIQGVSFSDEEWRTLQFGVLWVFFFIARIDGKISEDEMQELYELITTQEYAVPLQGAVMKSIGGDWANVLNSFETDGRTPAAGLHDVKSILMQRVPAEEANLFMTFLVALGGMVAAAPKTKGDITPDELAGLKVLVGLADE